MKQPLRRYRTSLLSIILLLVTHIVIGRDIMRYKRYTVQEGLSHRMISSIMQDSVGNIWLSTWNGLCKFDGETFTTYNETEDNQKIGRLALVRETTHGEVWTIRQSDMQEFILDQSTGFLHTIQTGSIKCRPVNKLPAEEALDCMGLRLVHDSITYTIPYAGVGMTTDAHYVGFQDRQGNIWANFDDALYQVTFEKARYNLVDFVNPAHSQERFGDEIRAMLALRDGGFLLACKNEYIYKYNADWQFEGYMTNQGKVSSDKISFGARIYCMKQAPDGSIWMGSRGQGLFQVKSPELDSQILIEGHKPSVYNYREGQVNNNHIFDLEFLGNDQLILATWDGGIQLLSWNNNGNISARNSNISIRKVRRIVVINSNLIALCSTQGICLVNKDLTELKRLGTMDFSDLVQSQSGTYYASSLNGSIYTFDLSPIPSQHEIDSLNLKNLGNEVTEEIIESISQTEDGSLWFVSEDQIIRYHPIQKTIKVINRAVLEHSVIYGEAKPLAHDQQLVIGTLTGIMQIDLSNLVAFNPSLQVDCPDTVYMEWGEEPRQIKATAMDLRLPRQIQYTWRELPDSVWNNLGENGRFSPSIFWPGTYRFEIRSTDAQQIWADNGRIVTIVVVLSQWQKIAIGSMLVLFIVLAIAGWSVRHKNPVEETIPISMQSGIQPTLPIVENRDQQFIEQVTQIIEEHIDDPMLDVEKLTTYMNISRTILYAKFKELLDSTPALFIAEIRLKRAIQLLNTRQYRINEVANMCGFSDPKYFTRSFKQRMGITPAKYIESIKSK